MRRIPASALLVVLCGFFATRAVVADAAPLPQVPVTVATALAPGRAFSFKFSLYTAATGGTKVWGPGSARLVVAADKTIAYTLGARPAFGPAVDFTQQLWLQVTGGGRTWRVPLPAAAYAFWSGQSETAATAGDADTVDGMHAGDLSPAAHQHAGEALVSGVVAEARVDGALARDAEVLDIVRAGDGPGSGVDADTLDGAHGAAFAGSAQLQAVQNTVAVLQQAIGALKRGDAGTLSGRVTSASLGTGIAGAVVTLSPGPLTVYTDGAGDFSLTLSPNTYTLTFSAAGFADQSREVLLAPNGTAQVSVALSAPAGVLVSAGPDVTIAPGDSLQITASVTITDASTLIGYSWRRLADGAEISTALAATVSAAYPKFVDLVGTASAPFDAPPRHQVMGMTPLGAERATRAMDREYEFTATTSSGSYSDRVKVLASSGRLSPTSGLRNVARGVPVILGAPEQQTYAWGLQKPAGSSAALDFAAERFVTFTPDLAGTYTVTEGAWSTTITTADWVGAVTGLDEYGMPVTGGSCGQCHDGTLYPRQSFGHDPTFKNGIESSTPAYGEACLRCHTVGYDTNAANGGFDDVAAGWTIPPPAPNNFLDLLDNFPSIARLGNVQCENCHGPGFVMSKTSPSRAVSLSSDVCGACHGQAEGHGRYQQWRGTGHADLQAAQVTGTASSHCARCHSAQGFVVWLAQGDLTRVLQGASGNATYAELVALGLTAEEVQPVTCAACHDPHVEGERPRCA